MLLSILSLPIRMTQMISGDPFMSVKGLWWLDKWDDLILIPGWHRIILLLCPFVVYMFISFFWGCKPGALTRLSQSPKTRTAKWRSFYVWWMLLQSCRRTGPDGRRISSAGYNMRYWAFGCSGPSPLVPPPPKSCVVIPSVVRFSCTRRDDVCWCQKISIQLACLWRCHNNPPMLLSSCNQECLFLYRKIDPTSFLLFTDLSRFTILGLFLACLIPKVRENILPTIWYDLWR